MITPKVMREFLIYQKHSKPGNQTKSYFLELLAANNNTPHHKY